MANKKISVKASLTFIAYTTNVRAETIRFRTPDIESTMSRMMKSLAYKLIEHEIQTMVQIQFLYENK